MKLPAIFVLSLCLALHGSQGHEDDSRDTGNKVRVCVIGAGAAGLSTARYLLAADEGQKDKFDVTVYEKTDDVGGTWVYTEEIGYDKHGYPIHSSMYKNLRTNLAKEFMNFPDYPEIQGQNRSCVPHAVIRQYLNNYTDHFNLRPFIKFNSPVESVKLDESEGSKDQWKVQVKNLETGEPEEETFDAVIICNGHYSDPYYPKIAGMENFEGEIMHSHSYRVPEVFKGRRVVLLGAASSGLDIALEVAKYADQTYLSHNNPDKVAKRKPLGFTEVKGIDRFEDGKFVLKDNRTLVADAIIFCTGYNFKYPFLDANTGIVVDDNYIKPLYKHMFNVDHPSMSFVGVPTGVVPFSMLHVQSQYIVSVLKGKAQLPAKEVMEQDAKLKTAKKRHAHKISNQWAYSDELARDGKFAPLPRYYRVASEAWNILKKEYPGDFKNFNLVIGADKVSVKIIRQPYRSLY